jgi:WD40 repeat protein
MAGALSQAQGTAQFVSGMPRQDEMVAGPFLGHMDWVSSVAFSPDGQRIVSGSFDKTIHVWDAMTGLVDMEFPFTDQCIITSNGWIVGQKEHY